VVHAVRALCRLRTMAEAADLACTTFAFTHEQTGATSTAVVAYDNHKGGIGFAAKGFDLAEGVLHGAVRLLQDCVCKHGCPACTGEISLDKATVLWALQSFFEVLPPPAHLAPVPPAVSLAANNDAVAEQFCPLAQVQERWPEVLAAIRGARAEHSGFFERVLRANARGARIALQLDSPELAAWAGQPACQPALEALLARFVAVPPGFRLIFEVSADRAESAARRRLQVRRRLEDFRRSEPHSESEANDRLASGFVLPSAQAPSAEAPPPRLYAPKAAPPGTKRPDPEPEV
jgi:DEAD/DEAH box helicase domain-containing protein